MLWCAHSAGSAQVRREYEYALGASKLVTPLLLDNTALAEGIDHIHAIDCRAFGGHNILSGNWPVGTSGTGIVRESVGQYGCLLPTVVIDQIRDAVLLRGRWATDRQSLPGAGSEARDLV